MRQIARALMLFWYAATAVLVITTSSPTLNSTIECWSSFIVLDWRHHGRVAISPELDHRCGSGAHRSDGEHRRSSPRRRFLLGLPIGFLLHSVFGASWATDNVFWWPFGGLDLGASDAAISSRGVTPLVLEIVGVGLTVWIMKRNHLQSWEQLRSWTRDGRLTFQ